LEPEGRLAPRRGGAHRQQSSSSKELSCLRFLRSALASRSRMAR
jgi:hypothetical protein